MLNKVIDLSFITQSVTNIITQAKPDYQSLYLRIASLFVEFSIQDIENAIRNLGDIPMTAQEQVFLEDLSIPVDEKNYTLKDTTREQIYLNYDTLTEIREIANKIDFPQAETRQRLLLQLIRAEEIAFEEFDLNDLVALYRVLSWVSILDLNKISLSAVLNLIKTKERLAPFYGMTSHFAGRTAELKELKNYVEWLPGETLLDSAKMFFYETFNWVKRPPLMVTGLGGIGKSTLMAKFIIDHLDYNGRGPLPFIYLDFDKPGLSLSNVMLLAIEAFRQVKVQFPDTSRVIDEVTEMIKKSYLSNDKFSNSSRSTDQQNFIQMLIERYNAAINMPVLVVFDSFEEIQARASSAELRVFFSFLRQLNEFIPRLRCVFVGRSEVIFEDVKFEHIKLGSFDQESAIGFLAEHGIDDKSLAKEIYDKFGGNPLTLNLAVNVILNEKLPNEGLNSVAVSSFFKKIDEDRIQQELVRRNLDHIKDSKVREIAIPGILVRLINPEIIQKVLARPCGLGTMTIKQAENIFTALQKESFLIQREGSDIYFRQDLRIALRELIVKENPEKARAIHDSAVAYYGQFKNEESRAEALYHRLMRGDDTTKIEKYFDPSMRSYLERSFVEFPESARLSIAPLLNLHVNSKSVKRSNIDDWERLMINQIRDTFLKGDDEDLLPLFKELRSRDERTTNTILFFYETKLYIRLGEIGMATRTLDNDHYARELISYDYIDIQLGTSLLSSKIAEYKLEFDRSFFLLNQGKRLGDNSQFFNADREDIIVDILFSSLRLCGRNRDYNLESVNTYRRYFSEHKRYFIIPKVYQRYLADSKQTLYDITIPEKLLPLFWSAEEFTKGITLLKQASPTVFRLEALLFNRWKVNLKDITEPGSAAVIYHDVLMYIELKCNFESFLSIVQSKNLKK